MRRLKPAYTRWDQVNPNGTIQLRQAPIIPLGLGLFKVWLPDNVRGNDRQYSAFIGVFRLPQKTLCDYLEAKLWDLFKSHDNEVGREFPGDKRGRTLTDCYIYARNVLMDAYQNIGRGDIAAAIGAIPQENGTQLAKYLASIGWRTYYWNPDVRNPRDGSSEHPTSYQDAKRTGNYYGIHVDDYVINYHRTNPATANDMTAFNEFSNVRFAFAIARGGTHNFMYSNGMTFEVHWDQEGQNLYERKSFYNFNWLSGLMLTPPGCK
jgi:hypothetical protein